VPKIKELIIKHCVASSLNCTQHTNVCKRIGIVFGSIYANQVCIYLIKNTIKQ